MKCASCKWAVNRSVNYCKCVVFGRRKGLLRYCKIHRLRDDCKEGIFLCDSFEKYNGDIHNICIKCLKFAGISNVAS